MKILENKGICMVLMLVLIVCGFLFGGYKGLAGQYRKAADVFFVGETGDGICIANDMGERANALTNLQTVAKKSFLYIALRIAHKVRRRQSQRIIGAAAAGVRAAITFAGNCASSLL